MIDSLELGINVDRFVRLIHVSLHPRASAVDEDRVGPFGGMVLMAIAERQPVQPQQLTQYFARDKSQMTRQIQTLERKGLLARAQSPEDARVALLSLTAKGRRQVVAFQNALAGVVDDLLHPLTDHQRAQFSTLLRKVVAGS